MHAGCFVRSSLTLNTDAAEFLEAGWGWVDEWRAIRATNDATRQTNQNQMRAGVTQRHRLFAFTPSAFSLMVSGLG